MQQPPETPSTDICDLISDTPEAFLPDSLLQELELQTALRRMDAANNVHYVPDALLKRVGNKLSGYCPPLDGAALGYHALPASNNYL